jgi:hypothetical protein
MHSKLTCQLFFMLKYNAMHVLYNCWWLQEEKSRLTHKTQAAYIYYVEKTAIKGCVRVKINIPISDLRPKLRVQLSLWLPIKTNSEFFVILQRGSLFWLEFLDFFRKLTRRNNPQQSLRLPCLSQVPNCAEDRVNLRYLFHFDQSL